MEEKIFNYKIPFADKSLKIFNLLSEEDREHVLKLAMSIVSFLKDESIERSLCAIPFVQQFLLEMLKKKMVLSNKVSD